MRITQFQELLECEKGEMGGMFGSYGRALIEPLCTWQNIDKDFFDRLVSSNLYYIQIAIAPYKPTYILKDL